MTDLARVFEDVWETGTVPNSWCHTRLKTIWKGAKKGKITDPETHRGIQIGSTFCKIVTIILKRLQYWYDKQLTEQQQGFRPERGTAEGIYLLKRLHQITHASDKPCYALFVDLSSAFDHVNRKWMFKTISQRLSTNSNKKLFQLLESIYKYTTAELCGTKGEVFEISTGVRQGGPESPTLFNLYMDYIMRVFIQRSKLHHIKFTKNRYTIPGAAVLTQRHGLGNYGTVDLDWIGYADDLVLAFDDIENLSKGLVLLNTTLTDYGMQVNVGKTKTIMILNCKEKNYPSTIVDLENVSIENVKVFQYLGSYIHFNQANTGDEEINMRIDSAECKFYAMGKKLMNYKIFLSTRVKMLNSLVRSRLTYACQTWTLNSRQMERICSTYFGMLRKMIRNGYKREGDTYRYVYSNQRLQEIAKTEHPCSFINRQQRSFVAHIVRRDDKCILKKALFNADEVHIPGRTPSLWKNVTGRENCGEIEFIRKAIAKDF